MLKIVFTLLLFAATSSFASTTCQTTYTNHSSSKMSFCITANGNIINLEGPPGWSQIQLSEGYAICSLTNSFFYYDIGVDGDSANWQASVISQPKGPNTFPYAITRTTADGQYTITQTFKIIQAGMRLGVTMSVTGPQAVHYVRFAEITPQTNQQGNHTSASAFVWTPNRDGLMISPTGVTVVSDVVPGGIQNPCVANGQDSTMSLRTRWDSGKAPGYFEYSVIR